MKSLLFAASTAVLLVACSEKQQPQGISDFATLRKEFTKPSREYGTAPLWVWNTAITAEMIDSSLTDLKDKGFGGVFVHPRPGLITEYMSDEWYQLFRHAVEKGKELDMNVWIYDENSYPSGFAGGHVPEQMPESFNQGVGLLQEVVDTFPQETDDYYLCLKDEDGKITDITAKAQGEKGKTGRYYLYKKTYYPVSPWFGGYSYVDLLYPGVTEKFIEITMRNGYERTVGDEFGKTIPGWFTDEPNINPPGKSIRWTPDLFDVFTARWGYDLKTSLPLLVSETGDWKTVRHNYQATLLDLFITRWAKPCYEYCEAHNLKFTGHYWEHGWPQMGNGPDNMAMYAWHQLPAIDMLFNRFDDVSPNAQFGNIRSVKELRSAANQTGRIRTLSETYGGGGWDETFRDFKRLGDWEYVLGVNFMNQHIADLSIAGARKADYPPVFSAVEPWWPYYSTLNLHFARLSAAMSAGTQVNDILVLEPTSTIWMYFDYAKTNKTYVKIGEAFQQFVTALEKAQTEYDLGSENIIRDRGSVSGNRFVVGACEYATVVIPPMMENLEPETFALLQQFADAGGAILAFAQPKYLAGKENAELSNFFAENQQVARLAELSPYISDYFASKHIHFKDVKGGTLYHQRRVLDDGQLLFMVNSDLNGSTTGEVTISGKDAVEMNSLTGEVTDYAETENDDKITLTFNLPPAGSLLLYVFNDKQTGFAAPAKTASSGTVIEPSAPLRAQPDNMNVLTIDFCDLTLGGETTTDMHQYDAGNKAFKAHGFKDGDPWNTSVQFGDNIVRRDTFTTGGFTVSYHFTVGAAFDWSDMQAVVERPQLYRISINGHEVQATDRWWLDREMRVVSIGKYVKIGVNTLTLALSPMKIHAEIEQVYIKGRFTLKSAAKGWVIQPPSKDFTVGSWRDQGWPFYPGTVTYTKHYTVADTTGSYLVRLNGWNGIVAAVVVNGKQAGVIGWEPYSVDVSRFLQAGDNTIQLKIAGSNQNLMGPFHDKGKPGVVGPGNFRKVQKYPAGIDYRQWDYGLTGDFTLEMTRE